MNLTIISSYPDEITVSQLRQRAEEMGVSVKVQAISSESIATDAIHASLGDNVLWRQSAIGPSGLSIGRGLLNKKVAINSGLYVMPEAANKFFQQQLLRNSPLAEYAIPTFYANSSGHLARLTKEGHLAFPVVSKPIAGTSGIGVEYLDSLEVAERKVKNWPGEIFQPYIENDGEWRVFVIGGAAIGAMRKVAPEGEKFNYVPSGARITSEEDWEVKKEIYRIAEEVTSLFHLELSGVDIVRDKHSGKYHVFEINSSPGWQNGFDRVTGVDVPQEIIQWFVEKNSLIDSQKPYQEVEAYLLTRQMRLHPTAYRLLTGVLFPYSARLQKMNVGSLPDISPFEAIKLYLSDHPGKLVGKLIGSENDPSIYEAIDISMVKDYFALTINEKLQICYLMRLNNQKSHHEGLVIQEAERALSWAGNFIMGYIDDSTTDMQYQHSLSDCYFATALYCALQYMKNQE